VVVWTDNVTLKYFATQPKLSFKQVRWQDTLVLFNVDSTQAREGQHSARCIVSQPHFEGSVRSPLTLPKMGLGSLPGLLKTQNSIVGAKIPRIEVFFIPLEISRSVDVQNGLA